jgi:hypothetical protein
LGFVGFSIQWPNMPFALYVGVLLAAVAFTIQMALRWLRRRAAGG